MTLSTENLKVPFGEKGGRLYAPYEVERGLGCGCTCPSCGARLVANKPQTKRNYFSHWRGADCPGGYETALHRMAKQIILEASGVTIPEHHIPVSAPLIDGQHLNGSAVFPPYWAKFESVVSERQEGRWRPDLTATLLNGTTLFVEICVTHMVETPKAEALDNLMEIDLGLVTPEVVADLDALRDEVLTKARRYWYRCSLYDGLKRVQRARDRLKAEAAIKNRQILESRARAEKKDRAKRMIEEKERAGREQHRALLKEIIVMQRPGAIDRRLQQLDAAGREALESALQRWSSEYGITERPRDVGVSVNGQWIVNASPGLWQSFVFETFILRATPGQIVRTQNVVSAIRDRHGFLPWMEEAINLRRSIFNQRRQQGREVDKRQAIWFFSRSENAVLVDPFGVVLQYLDTLALSPFGYLQHVSEKRRFDFRVAATRPGDPAVAAATPVRPDAPFPSVNRAVQIEFARRAHEAQEQRRIELLEGRVQRNQKLLARMQALLEKSIVDAQLCSYCHVLTERGDSKTCQECGKGALESVQLTPEYVYSYPFRLTTMPIVPAERLL